VRGAGDPSALVASVRAQVAAVDPELALFNVQTAESALAGSLAPRRFNAWLLAVFAGVALTLAIVGVYGVLSYAVTQRTREMGVRLALGASSGQILRMVVGDGMRLVALAVGLGIASALALGRVLESLLYGVTAQDPLTFGSVAGVLALTALAACYVPARRATRIDATAALRGE
jgi:putative ABC transport system permease protein